MLLEFAFDASTAELVLLSVTSLDVFGVTSNSTKHLFEIHFISLIYVEYYKTISIAFTGSKAFGVVDSSLLILGLLKLSHSHHNPT